MAAPSHPPAPVPIYLCGSKPGVFDPTQPARLLRYPNSTLLFASFDRSTSSSPSLSTDARRIAVEVTQPNDFSAGLRRFSFVPSAGLAPGVVNEGEWPRVVNYCGQLIVCDQDQWDIHKLDPAYDCFVPSAGTYPTIIKKFYVQFSAGAFQASDNDRGGLAPYLQGMGIHSCPDISMGDATSAASSEFTVFMAWLGATNGPLPSTASSAAPSSGQPLPRTPGDNEDVVRLAWAGEHVRHPQTGHEQFAAGDALSALRQAQGTASLAGHTASARLDLERRQRGQAHRQQWIPWTPQRAIDRYLAVSQPFDSAMFSREDPVDLLLVPWPVLRSPFSFHVNQLDWQMVEAFFQAAACQMGTEDYRALVAESRRRFHPDRWHCRGIFKTCDDQLARALERGCMIISQAVNAIWDALQTE